MNEIEKVIKIGGIDNIEKVIISILGYHEVLVEICGVRFWRLLDNNNFVVGFAEYNKSTGIHHIRINAPTIWLDIKRHEDSKEITCKYNVNYEKKGKAKIYVK